MRSFIGPIILLALAAGCGVLGRDVQPLGWKWVSLDAALPVAAGTSRFSFVEPDGGYHGVAVRAKRRGGWNETDCAFLPNGDPIAVQGPPCPRGGAPLRLAWQVLDGGAVAAKGGFATGDPVGWTLSDDPTKTYLLGAEFPLVRGRRYTLILHNASDLSALAGAEPRLLVVNRESGEGPLFVQALELLAALAFGLAGAVWGAAAVIGAFRRRRRTGSARNA